MGKIVSNFFISLDGVVERPDQWHFPYFDDEMGAAVSAGMDTADAMMMGRVLYDEWSAYWTGGGRGQRVRRVHQRHPEVRRVVVGLRAHLAEHDRADRRRGGPGARGEGRDGARIQMSGSPTLVRWLLAEGLLDELHLLVHPIAVGHGERLFQDTPTHPLRLLSSTTFGSGVLHLVYAPAEEKPPADA